MPLPPEGSLHPFVVLRGCTKGHVSSNELKSTFCDLPSKHFYPLASRGVLDSRTLDAFIANPGGPLWLQSNYERALEDHLSNSYPLVLGALRHLQNSFGSLCKQLGFSDKRFQQALEERLVGLQGYLQHKCSVEMILT